MPPRSKFRTIELRFPSAGVSRRRGHQEAIQQVNAERRDQRVYYTPWAVNVTPQDSISNRLRGGSRLGLVSWTGSLPTVTSDHGVPLSWSDTVGSHPTDCTVGCIYRDRQVLAGADNAVYFSRQGAHGDWNFGASVTDTGRATALQLSESGEVGDTATALIPYRDGNLLMGTANELWLLQGDPTSGRQTNISREHGIVNSTAFTRVADSVIFLSDDGLFQCGADGSGLQHISDELPEHFRDIASTATVAMGYDARRKTVYICIQDGTTYSNWLLNLRDMGFWPLSFSAGHQPEVMHQLDGELVFQCADSGRRVTGGNDDSGTNIESHLLLGPFQPGTTNWFGLINTIHGAIADGSDDVQWRIVIGETAEEACENGKEAIEYHLAGSTSTAEAYAEESGTWASGLSQTSRPRVRAMWAVIWLQASDAWAFEGVNLEVAAVGRWR